MNMRIRTALTLSVLLLAAFAFNAAAKIIPAQLPDPDGKPGDAAKPVKVYILAGQSNMVGMGDLHGARNMYNGVFLTADPAAPKQPLTIFRVGNYNILPLTLYKTDGTETDQPIAQGQLEVPRKGIYRVHGGSCDAIEIEGKPIYWRTADGVANMQEIALEPGKRYAFKITGFAGSPPRFWLQKTDLLGHGDLEAVAIRDGLFPWLTDGKGEWTVRNDVYFQEARVAKEGRGCPLSATSNGKSIGPELGFGHVMGQFHDEQVLLIKTAMGNRSLGFDFRPPSSGRTDPDSEWESKEYKLMIEGVRKTLNKIDKVVPGYQGQGYEMAGFLWFQGHKDSFDETLIADYEKNMVNMINDVRREFKAPKMPVVVATVGFGGHNMQDKFVRILKAQMAVGDPAKHPEFAGTVASVDIRDYWREVDESPRSQDYHYNRNAETYMRIGDAMGRAMVGLLGGKAETLPQPLRPKRTVKEQTAEPTEQEIIAAQKALAPIILNGIAAEYIANPRYNKALLAEAEGQRPQRANQFLRGAMYGLINCYRAAGVHDYDWKLFGDDLRDKKWDHFTFHPKEPKAKTAYRKVTWPDGMAHWFATDFDAAAAGWKKGLPPFGQLQGKLEPIRQCPRMVGGCGCGEKPRTLWDKEVLMVRGTFDFPPLREGHRYRIVIGGSNHVNAGEGFALYVNGKLLAESTHGVGKRQGGEPRGGHIYADVLDEFKGGKVTLAVCSFLRQEGGSGPFPNGHLTVWLEEQKIPPVLLKATAGQ